MPTDHLYVSRRHVIFLWKRFTVFCFIFVLWNFRRFYQYVGLTILQIPGGPYNLKIFVFLKLWEINLFLIKYSPQFFSDILSSITKILSPFTQSLPSALCQISLFPSPPLPLSPFPYLPLCPSSSLCVCFNFKGLYPGFWMLPFQCIFFWFYKFVCVYQILY